ncbi:MAG: hypothetical protein ACYS8L_07705 [Planctomycetota bacterium]|jgi:hypothetical protein
MEKVRYEEMLPHEIVARRRKFPAAFIGLGGLEWHGEHLLRSRRRHPVEDAIQEEEVLALLLRPDG